MPARSLIVNYNSYQLFERYINLFTHSFGKLIWCLQAGNTTAAFKAAYIVLAYAGFTRKLFLCKSFSNAGLQQHVIKNMDIEILEGDFTVIMGSSGSGKSTLLYALSGMDKPTLGKVYFGDEEMGKKR